LVADFRSSCQCCRDRQLRSMRFGLLLMGAAAADGCNKTVGTCLTSKCDTGRGPTNCIAGVCRCASGFCADENGVCRASIGETCSRDTGGTCRTSSCSNYRGPTQCFDNKCLCKTGYCADSAGVCQPSGEGLSETWSNELDGTADGFSCSRLTGASCLSCDGGRGPSQCFYGACMCRKNTCSDEQGICHPVFVPGAGRRDTGGTCYGLQCSDFRGPTSCSVDRTCICDHGYFTDLTGVCVKVGTDVFAKDGFTSLGSVGKDSSKSLAAATLMVASNSANVVPVALLVLGLVGTLLKLEGAKVVDVCTSKRMVAAFALICVNLKFSADLAAEMGGNQLAWLGLSWIVDVAVLMSALTLVVRAFPSASDSWPAWISLIMIAKVISGAFVVVGLDTCVFLGTMTVCVVVPAVALASAGFVAATGKASHRNGPQAHMVEPLL